MSSHWSSVNNKNGERNCHDYSESVSDYCSTPSTAIYWREQVNCQWDDDDVHL